MKTILNAIICLVFFMLGWSIGTTLDSQSTDFSNCFILWGLLLGLILLRVKIINN